MHAAGFGAADRLQAANHDDRRVVKFAVGGWCSDCSGWSACSGVADVAAVAGVAETLMAYGLVRIAPFIRKLSNVRAHRVNK